jgi:hypothetical protein
MSRDRTAPDDGTLDVLIIGVGLSGIGAARKGYSALPGLARSLAGVSKLFQGLVRHSLPPYRRWRHALRDERRDAVRLNDPGAGDANQGMPPVGTDPRIIALLERLAAVQYRKPHKKGIKK